MPKKKTISIKMSDEILFVQNGYVGVPELTRTNSAKPTDIQLQSLGTIISNLAFYGFIPSLSATQSIMKLNDVGIAEFWNKLQPALAYVSGADRKMDDFVVYKNFPNEVLEMSEAQYWTNQILMYWGLPSDHFTQPVKERKPLAERKELKVLELSGEDTGFQIFGKLCRINASWTDFQDAQVSYLLDTYSQLTIHMDDFAFKENGAKLIAKSLDKVLSGRRKVGFSTATDVLRLAAALSDGDVSLRENVRFRKFKRPERRLLVGLIDGGKNIVDDFARRPEVWKRLLSALHPGEFKAPNVSAAYDRLINRQARTLDAAIEAGMLLSNPLTLDQLKKSPGQFARRLHQAYDIFGANAFDAFKTVLGSLSVSQLVKLDGYLRGINTRKTLIATPRGSWTKAKIVDNTKKKIDVKDLHDLRLAISETISRRLSSLYPQGFKVSPKTDAVKLQSNGQELAAYGRGTSFDIPENVQFIRTASYWQAQSKSNENVWFDVGWNFFDDKWKPISTVCWDRTHPFGSKAAIFSGDPTNKHDLKGRACQMIDLYPSKLIAEGARYAVWNVLAYSNIPFSDVPEVLATLQWGEQPEEGNLFEPGRAQMVFPLTGQSKGKYVAYIDLKERRLVYMDLDLRANVASAKYSERVLEAMMPSVVEHFAALPSVADVFKHENDGEIPVVFDDLNIEINGPAYVFQPRNAENKIEQIDLEKVLNAKDDVLLDPTNAARPGF